MERYFTLDRYNTWADWGLIVTAKDTTPPEPKTNYVDIEGRDGTLDLTEALTGGVTYGDRTVSASFWTCEGSRKDRERRIREIISTLHGRKIKIIEPDDLTHYFMGRVNISGVVNHLAYSTFNLEAVCEPWRYAVDESVRTVAVSNTEAEAIVYNNGVKTLCPDIAVSGSINITYPGISVNTLTTGNYKIPDLKLYRGANTIGISGNGTIAFVYREGDL